MSTSRQNYRYLPLYPEIDGWGARVLDTGFTQVSKGETYPALGHPDDHQFSWETGRRLNAYTFVYITAGEGVFESEASAPAKVTAGDLFVIFPGIWHRFRPDIGVGWNEHWVECEGKLLEAAIKRTGLDPSQPVIPVGYDLGLLECFSRILETAQAEPPGYQAIVGLQSVIIVARISSLLQTARHKAHDSDDKLVRQGLMMMSEGISGRMDWEGLASNLGISYSSFRRIFSKVTSRSPGDFFIEMKINKAKEMLQSPDHSIQDISTALGFDSPSHFSRSFKARTGIPPRQYRGTKGGTDPADIPGS